MCLLGRSSKLNQELSCTWSLFPVNLQGEMYELIRRQIGLDLRLSWEKIMKTLQSFQWIGLQASKNFMIWNTWQIRGKIAWLRRYASFPSSRTFWKRSKLSRFAERWCHQLKRKCFFNTTHFGKWAALFKLGPWNK